METDPIKRLDAEIARVNKMLKVYTPLWVQITRKCHALEHEIRVLEDERAKLLQGQLPLAIAQN